MSPGTARLVRGHLGRDGHSAQTRQGHGDRATSQPRTAGGAPRPLSQLWGRTGCADTSAPRCNRWGHTVSAVSAGPANDSAGPRGAGPSTPTPSPLTASARAPQEGCGGREGSWVTGGPPAGGTGVGRRPAGAPAAGMPPGGHVRAAWSVLWPGHPVVVPRAAQSHLPVLPGTCHPSRVPPGAFHTVVPRLRAGGLCSGGAVGSPLLMAKNEPK